MVLVNIAHLDSLLPNVSSLLLPLQLDHGPSTCYLSRRWDRDPQRTFKSNTYRDIKIALHKPKVNPVLLKYCEGQDLSSFLETDE